MKLDEQILAAVASGMLLGATSGCRPTAVPTDTSPVASALSEEPKRQDTAPVEDDGAADEVVRSAVADDAANSPPSTDESANDRPVCAAGFTEEDIASALNGRGAHIDDNSLQCADSCNRLQTSWGGPNTEYFRVCGTWEEGAKCCHVYSSRRRKHYRGRPFIVEGSARTGEIARTASWSAAVRVEVGALSPDERVLVSDAWARAGAEEHASIASFSQFLLDLMSLGAPPRLIQGVTQAIAEEVEHAQACFGVAGAVAEEPLGPGPIDLDGTTCARTPEEILRAVIRQGCIGEALAAHLAGWSATRASDATVKAVLTAIADDESRHAALAWEFVAWLLQVQPSLTEVARVEFAATGPPATVPTDSHGPDLTVWGVIPLHVEAELNARAMREIIAPAAKALLAQADA